MPFSTQVHGPWCSTESDSRQCLFAHPENVVGSVLPSCGRGHLSSRDHLSYTNKDKARTRRMQAALARPWLGRVCGLEYATLIEPHLRSRLLAFPQGH
ncbi:hypothetical protein KM043_016558 [Ampulex compressa]|nr:hypothetical protein KM043_016558 [Ampulex compressa]